MFLIGLRCDWYGDRVQDSPLTENDDMVTLVGGIAYTFRK
jgi:outer membrane scaffolding protein for murein synthesis (MipA/OmpV family)